MKALMDTRPHTRHARAIARRAVFVLEAPAHGGR